jgi:hypothetical protein
MKRIIETADAQDLAVAGEGEGGDLMVHAGKWRRIGA